MQGNGFRNLLANTMQRIQACHRLLKNNPRQIAANTVQRVGVGADDVLTIQRHATRWIRPTARQQL